MDAGQNLGPAGARVLVGICTCRNPAGLEKLLNALSTHESEHRLSYLVVDNDAGEAGREIVTRFPAITIRYVVEQQSGIPFARNRIIAEALAVTPDYLLMIDDDERPLPGWVDTMVATAVSRKADLVAGGVLPVFEVEPVDPVRREDFQKLLPTYIHGVQAVDSTANILIAGRLLSTWTGEFFDWRFAQSGGSDSEFLRRTTEKGCRHAFATNAVVLEDIPPLRAREDWLLRRNYRNGNVLGRVTRFHKGTLRALIEVAPRAVALMVRGALRLLSAGSSRQKYLARKDIRRGRGMIDAFAGRVFQEYDKKNYR